MIFDFGRSFWSSADVTSEYPQLLTTAFRPTGQYGIGFFAVFMLGSTVRVVTRPYRAAQDDTRVLEFPDGLDARPLLRLASSDEQLEDGGTRIEVRLDQDPRVRGGLLDDPRTRAPGVAALCQYLCPALDVDVVVAHDDQDHERVVLASDWLNLPYADLCRRIRGGREPTIPSPFEQNLRPLLGADGEVLGRACVFPSLVRPNPQAGVVAVGGLRAVSMGAICGILPGRSTTAARDLAIPVVDRRALAEWATAQAALVAAIDLDTETLLNASAVIVACAGDTGRLPIALTSAGWLTRGGLRDWAAERSEVVLISRAEHYNREREGGSITLGPNVLVANSAFTPIIESSIFDFWPTSPSVHTPGPLAGTLAAFALEIVAAAWDVTPAELEAASLFSDDHTSARAEIGRQAAEPLVSHSVHILRGPRPG